MTMQFEMMQEARIMKMRTDRHDNTYYDHVYKALDFVMRNGPLTKYRISNKKTIIELLIANEFIQTTLDILASERGRKGEYYVITKKGLEYLRIFENLQKLFG